MRVQLVQHTDTCRWSVEATSEWMMLEDRKFKGVGDTAGPESQWGRSHILRWSAGDMLGLEGNGRGGRRDTKWITHKHRDSSDHMAGVDR